MRRLLHLALAVTLLAGCGLQSHAGTSGVTITITRDFGAHVLRVIDLPSSHRSLSAQGVLESAARVRAVAGGGVEAIDGVVAGPGERWSEFVNGVGQVDRPGNTIGPSAQVVHPGDRLWFDLHAVGAGPSLQSAVVGAFPEPFRHGTFGKRFPTTLECAGDVASACRHVSSELSTNGCTTSHPAQDTSTPTGPSSRSAAATAARMADRCDTSAWSAQPRSPSFPAVASAPSMFRSTAATRQPSSPSRSATALPIPLAAPVTIATPPSSPLIAVLR